MKSTQSDKGLGFDGAEVVAARKPSQSVNKNQWSGHSNDGRTVNMGRGPTKGNTGTKRTPGTMELKGRPANPDAINAGAQVRTPGGTRAFDPKCCGNYQGNADRINAGRGPTKGNE